ncbi:hypothetical protein [Ulvibacterium sp.]|uniref:hypothetical protein n=1 Tax=Ulvibacterium sp. TaxID=2665914 RepID=UPI003BAD66A4
MGLVYRYILFLSVTVAVNGQENGTPLKPMALNETNAMWGANWSPDNSRITYTDWGHFKDDGLNFSWKWDIFLCDRDGKNVKNLTQSNTNDFASSWSPKGDAICFVSDRDGDLDIYIMDSNGKHIQNLTNNNDDEFGPMWSPDGTRIAFTKRTKGQTDIFTIDLANGNIQQLTQSKYDDNDPFWSPSGESLVFSSNRTGPFQIYSISPKGIGLKRRTYTTSNETGPSYSNDGTRITFTSDRDNVGPKRREWNFVQIYAMDTLGKGSRRLVFDRMGGSSQPRWSKDDEYLLFTSWRKANRDIYIVTSNGIEKEVITSNFKSEFYKMALNQNVGKAIESFQESIKIAPDSRFFSDAELRNLGMILYENGRFGEALELYTFYRDRKPSDELAQDFLLFISQELGKDVPPNSEEIVSEIKNDFKSGFILLSKLIARFPEWYIIGPSQFVQIYKFLKARNRTGDQILLLELAIKKYPDNSMLIELLGDTYSLLDNSLRALRHYKKAVQLNPDSTQLLRKIKNLEEGGLKL